MIKRHRVWNKDMNSYSGSGSTHHLGKQIFEIIPEDNEIIETYIGMNDIKGEPIFEGDIVWYDNHAWVVIFNETYLMFMLRPFAGRERSPIQLSITLRLEIIGNENKKEVWFYESFNK